MLGKLLAQSQSYYQVNQQAAEKLLGIGLTPVPQEMDQVELASWTIVARAVLNLSEVFTRN